MEKMAQTENSGVPYGVSISASAGSYIKRLKIAMVIKNCLTCKNVK